MRELALAVMIAATVVQLIYWVGFFSRLAWYRPEKELKKANHNQPSVSIIICARNEAENLTKNLDRFLNQKYRSFEIIVVNDASTDNTEKVLLDFQAKSSILRIVNLHGSTPPGKKAALERGIQTARFDIVLLSDADCAPATDFWLATMAANFGLGFDIALGYSPYYAAPGLLNAFIRFETTFSAIHYLSFALAGFPYMGVGRNLAYRKSLFEQAGGFRSHRDVASGDDDLFVNAAAHRRNTTIVLQPAAFVYSEPKRSWQGYYHQKSRHLTTGRKYKVLHQVMLGGFSASHSLHYLGLFGVLLFLPDQAPAAFFCYAVRIGVVAYLYSRILVLLNDRSLQPWIPVFDLVYLFYYFVFAPILFIGRNHKPWK